MTHSSDAWVCPGCAEQNEASAAHCSACGAARPPDALHEIRAAQVLRSEGAVRARSPRPTALWDSPLRPEDLHPTADVAHGDSSRPEAVTDSAAAALETHLHGLRPVGRTAASSGPSRVSPALLRAVPLLGLVLAAAITLGGVTRWQLRIETDAAADRAPTRLPGDPPTVILPAVDAILGLTEDNKEAVLNLCWRVSGNPIHECQPSRLREDGEYPHRVAAFPALRIDVWEVSNALWQRCEEAGACAPRAIDSCRFHTIHRYELGRRVPDGFFASDRPAVCVSLEEASALCAWRGMRLPTAEEWERAARAGEDRMQPWGSFWTPALINWGERDLVGFPIPGRLDGAEFTAAVDAYPDGATREGVLNLFGNVSEWVQASADEAAEGRAGLRGSNYTDEVMSARVTRHRTLPSGERRSTVGFRCIGEAPGP